MLTWMGKKISRRRMTVAERWGCIAAIILGVPVFIFLLAMDIFGDCAPNTACNKGFLTQVLVPSAVIAVGIGLLVRWAIKMAWRRNDS
jgi:hypothetical protein